MAWRRLCGMKTLVPSASSLVLWVQRPLATLSAGSFWRHVTVGPSLVLLTVKLLCMGKGPEATEAAAHAVHGQVSMVLVGNGSRVLWFHRPLVVTRHALGVSDLRVCPARSLG